MIATYSLCGFANFGSIGITLGALSAMAPHRRKDIAAIVVRAMIAGNVACFLTGCIAGELEAPSGGRGSGFRILEYEEKKLRCFPITGSLLKFVSRL